MIAPRIRQHGLYGDDAISVRPEFVHIEPISTRSGPHGWTISPHAHPGILQLLLVERGGGTLATEAMEARLEAGTLIHLPNGCVHAFRFEPGTEGWVLSLAADLLSDPRVAALTPAPMVAANAPRWACPGQSTHHYMRLAWLMRDIASLLAGGMIETVSPALIAQLCLVLALADETLSVETLAVETLAVETLAVETLADEALASGARAGGTAPKSREAALVQRFRALVGAHYRDGWTVEGYAAALGTSAPTLTRACRTATGKPPGVLLLDRLLLEAMRALTYTSEPVTRIADGLGFSDPAYFARFFKRRTGATASAFRRDGAWLRGAQ